MAVQYWIKYLASRDLRSKDSGIQEQSCGTRLLESGPFDLQWNAGVAVTLNLCYKRLEFGIWGVIADFYYDSSFPP